MLKLTILGTSSAMAAHGRKPSSQVLDDGTELHLIDCGEGTQFQLKKFGIKFQKINHIFISHLHGDHFYGLIGLLSTMNLLGRNKPLKIYAHHGLAEIITTQLKYSESVLEYDVQFIPLADKEDLVLETKQLKISSFPLNHRIPCNGFVFSEKEKALGLLKERISKDMSYEELNLLKQGQNVLNEDGSIKYNYADYTHPRQKSSTYAYVTDTRFDETIVNKINNVDLLYHEATFLHELFPRAEMTYHSTALEAGKMAQLSNVKCLMIGHFSTRYKDPKVLLDETKKEFKNTILASEGETIQINNS